MKLNNIIMTICFSLVILFASGADANPLWVTLLGMVVPMMIMLVLTRLD